ncbi:MAG: SdrD B-like domain-containing protein, partial [Bacilli bacterium]
MSRVEKYKKKWKLSGIVALIVLLVLNTIGITNILTETESEAAVTNSKLGTIEHFNAVVFSDHSASSADIEGPIAVQGNMKYDTVAFSLVAATTGAFNLAGAPHVNNGMPSILLGGSITAEKGVQVEPNAGDIVVNGDTAYDPTGIFGTFSGSNFTPNYKYNTNPVVKKSAAEIQQHFSELKGEMEGAMNKAKAYTSKTPISFASFGIGKSEQDKDILVSSSIENVNELKIGDFYLPSLEDKKALVIYSNAKKVSFKNGAIVYDQNGDGVYEKLINTSQPYSKTGDMSRLAPKILWVFPEATDIDLAGYGIIGNVFAPKANIVASGGSINGQVFADKLKQTNGFEVHNFRLNWNLWKTTTPPPPVAKGELGNFVWIDKNENGIQDQGEKGVSGVTVELQDGGNAKIAETTTSATGEYYFKDLNAGTYKVVAKLPNGFDYKFGTSFEQGNDATKDANKGVVSGTQFTTEPVELKAGETNHSIDIAVQELGMIGDYVWYDKNYSGTQDVTTPAEPAMKDVSVVLQKLENGTFVDLGTPVLTDDLGKYLFKGLENGTYRVKFPKIIDGKNITTNKVGNNPAIDSDPLPNNNATQNYVITPNITIDAVTKKRLDVDAGYSRTGSIGDQVWIEKGTKDGLFGAGDLPIADIKIELHKKNGTDFTLVTSTVSDIKGQYNFTGLKNGTYKVKFIAPKGYDYTVSAAGDVTTNNDSDAATDGFTKEIQLDVDDNAKRNITTVDAGFELKNSSIGDFVFIDENGNNVYDAAVDKVKGNVTVELYKTVGAVTSKIATDVTNATTGTYLFSNLEPGTYEVRFVKPSGYAFVEETGALKDVNNSDANVTTGRTVSITLGEDEHIRYVDAGIHQL